MDSVHPIRQSPVPGQPLQGDDAALVRVNRLSGPPANASSNPVPNAVNSVRSAAETKRRPLPREVVDALEIQDQIEKHETNFENQKLQLYRRYLRRTRVNEDPQTIRRDLRRDEQALVKKFNRESRNLFEVQKSRLATLMTHYNTLLDRGDQENLPRLELALSQLEARIEMRDASNSSRNLHATRVRLYGGVLYKRLQYMEEKRRLQQVITTSYLLDPRRYFAKRKLSQISAALQNRTNRTLRAGAQLDQAVRQMAAREQAQGPALKDRVISLDGQRRKIQSGLATPPRLVSNEAATQFAQHTASQLRWGESHVQEVLASPTNWPTIRRVALMRSASGKRYAFATEIESIRNVDGANVPSGLRNKPAYRHLPTNFQRTRFYMIGNEEQTLAVSYRGAQFPTAAAAKAALITMMKETRATDFHINALLTPNSLPKAIAKDRFLIKQHQESIVQALREIQQELAMEGPLRQQLPDYDPQDLLLMEQQTLILSNFGVNEGAQGDLLPTALNRVGISGPRVDARFGGTASLGWHYSTQQFNNEAMHRLSTTVYRRLDRVANKLRTGAELDQADQRLLAMLAPLSEAGMELQRLWKTNAFANGSEGNDPFKMPATLKVLDLLVGIVSYVDCMSGKDRTGEVESAAHWRWAELQMNIAEHRQALLAHAEEEDYADVIDALFLNPSFTTEDLDELAADTITLRGKYLEKVRAVQELLDFTTSSGFLPQKQVHSLPLPGTQGIEKTPHQPKLYPNFPELMPKTGSHEMRDRHFMAANRRQMMAGSGAGAVTLENTAYAGSKTGSTKGVLEQSAGFDAEHVIARSRNAQGAFNTTLLKQAVRLDRLDLETQQALSKKLGAAPTEDQVRKWLRSVAQYKRKSFKPVYRVKS